MSKQQQKPAEEEGESVGLWYISFADMITLLMSFFVMLQTMATDKSVLLMRTGSESFKRAIEGFGMPDFLNSKREKPEFDFKQERYPVSRPSSQPGRIIDDETDEVKKVYQELSRAAPTRASEVEQRSADRRFPAVRFGYGSYELSAASKTQLDDLAGVLQNLLGDRRIEICITGLANEAGSIRDQWILSAQRATAVENYLRQRVTSQLASHRWQILSKGMGDGKAFRATLGEMRRETQIVITITNLSSAGQ